MQATRETIFSCPETDVVVPAGSFLVFLLYIEFFALQKFFTPQERAHYVVRSDWLKGRNFCFTTIAA